MNLHRALCSVVIVLVAGAAVVSAQQKPLKGVTEDWSTRHVKFSYPGTEADAIAHGTHDRWLRVVNNPRYRMEQMRRSKAWSERFARVNAMLAKQQDRFGRRHRGGKGTHQKIKRDWSYQVAPIGYGSYAGTYPAKYGFDVNATPSCADFVVYPVDQPGSLTVGATPGQANLIGFNNLYDGTCPGSEPTGQPFTPTVMFAYDVGPGNVESSPSLSLDGTKVAFIENDTTNNDAVFHVLTLGTTGNNGTDYQSPAQPCTVNGAQVCTTNNAVDVTFSYTAATVSSPMIDYAHDVAYVVDGNSLLHKYTGVFSGTPTEVTTGGWPYQLTNAFQDSSPVYDGVSEHVFIADVEGNLNCVDVSSGDPAACATASVSIGTVGSINDSPIVDSTTEKVFISGSNEDTGSQRAVLMQTDTNLGSMVSADMGPLATPGSLVFDGTFDNTYFSGSYSSGYLYFCGWKTDALNKLQDATLFRVGFNSTGTMSATTDTGSFRLATNNAGCSPLSEFYNATESSDYLYLSVNDAASPSGCQAPEAWGCIISFTLGSAFPTEPTATFPTDAEDEYESGATGGIIIDNVSSVPGASQVYFVDNTGGLATQASQDQLF